MNVTVRGCRGTHCETDRLLLSGEIAYDAPLLMRCVPGRQIEIASEGHDHRPYGHI